MNKKIFLIKFLLIFLIFLTDQISKYYIINVFKSQNEEIYLTSFLNFQLIWNEGIAFGLLSFENDLYYNSITFLIVVVILILLFLIRNNDQSSYFYSMIIGGALGNLTDRIRYSSEHYLKSDTEMSELFSDLPEALKNNYNFSLRCNYRPLFSKPILPNISSSKDGNANDIIKKESLI